jgi:molecular chaperone DnaK
VATTRISLPFVAARAGTPIHLDLEMSRAELESVVRPVIERCRGPVEHALRDAGRTPKDIDRLVFVGGPTRMPVVRRFFEEIFGRPAEMGVDPMECVAAGAAIQAGVLAGDVRDIVLVDVTPLTLGVETLGGIATGLIARNSPIPTKRTETFTTAADLQTSVTIHVFQGERSMSADNTSLGEFTLGGLPPAPRGVPKIEVTFDIDASGILDVSAKDVATGRSQAIRISGSTRLGADERQRMVAEAERYAQEDKKRREDAESLNRAEAVAYEADKTIADFGDKLVAEQRQQLADGARAVREALAKRDAALATKHADALRRRLKEAGAAIYAQAGVPPYAEVRTPQAEPGTSTGAPGPVGPAPRERVVDANFTEKPRP